MKRWLSRSTVFGAFFAISSFFLACHGKLSTAYVAVIGAVHGFIVFRAIAEDKQGKQ